MIKRFNVSFATHEPEYFQPAEEVTSPKPVLDYFLGTVVPLSQGLNKDDSHQKK